MAKKVAKTVIFILIGIALVIMLSQKQETIEGNIFDVELKEFKFSPNNLIVNQNDLVKIKIINTGRISHTFTLPDFDIDVSLKPGESEEIEFMADKIGTFDGVCTIFGHKELGMRFKLEVKENV